MILIYRLRYVEALTDYRPYLSTLSQLCHTEGSCTNVKICIPLPSFLRRRHSSTVITVLALLLDLSLYSTLTASQLCVTSLSITFTMEAFLRSMAHPLMYSKHVLWTDNTWLSLRDTRPRLKWPMVVLWRDTAPPQPGEMYTQQSTFPVCGGGSLTDLGTKCDPNTWQSVSFR